HADRRPGAHGHREDRRRRRPERLQQLQPGGHRNQRQHHLLEPWAAGGGIHAAAGKSARAAGQHSRDLAQPGPALPVRPPLERAHGHGDHADPDHRGAAGGNSGNGRQCLHRRAHAREPVRGRVDRGRPEVKRTYNDAPPSIAIDCPVTCRDASEAKYTAIAFRSSSPPRRPSGVCAITSSPITCRIPRDIFEGKNPGQRAFTLISYFPHSAASARVKWSTAALLVVYAMVAIPLPWARRTSTEAMLMIFPLRRGIMQRRPTSWQRKNIAFTFRFITLCQASAGCSSAGAPQVVPALLTRMSMVP